MQPYVAMYGTSGKLSNSNVKDPAQLLAEVWDNSGNLVFQRAATHLVDAPILTVGRGCEVDGDQSRVGKECKAIVFPAANHISPKNNLESLAQWLGYTNLPVVVLGIGAQAPDCSNAALESLVCEFTNNGGFHHLMDVFKRDSVFVGVRGEFTRRLLRRFGVDSTVIGCPSLLLNSQPDLGRQLQMRYERLRAWLKTGNCRMRLAVTAASPWGEKEMSAEMTLIRWLFHFGGKYIQQSGGVEVFRLVLQRFSSEIERGETYELLRHRYGQYGSTDAFKKLIEEYSALYFDVDDWEDAIAGCDFSLGSRYHGNALAMQRAVPALVTTHDSRTEELCGSTMIPTVDINKIRANTELRDLVDEISFDGREYDERRRTCAASVASAFDRAGVKPSVGLRRLANSIG